MRIVLSLASLLIVLFVVMRLASQQAKELAPAAASAPQQQARNVANQIEGAIEKGAAARASEADAQ
jgi:hypothetical protein